MKIFICAPYTPNDLEIGSIDYNYRQDYYINEANEIGKKLLLKGHVPIIPHNFWSRWEHDSRFKDFPHSKWIDMTTTIMFQCQGIFLAPGWIEQKGCISEFRAWSKMFDHQNVFYCIEDVK